MTRYLRLELRRYPTTAIRLAAAAGASLLAALYFFAVIGRFDSSPDSTMFRSYSAIFGLSLTISLLVVVVYGAVIYARLLVADYIGNRRIQLYVYPAGRAPLFLAKNAAYAMAAGIATLSGITAATALFCLIEWFAPVVTGGRAIGASAGTIGAGILCVTVLATSLVVLSGMIGVFRGSTIATTVSAIILITLFGNSIAISLASTVWVTIMITAGCAAIALVALSAQARRIQRDEVL